MIVIFLLIPLSIVIATGFLLAFIWAVRSGQYEDTCTPSMRLLLDEQDSSQSCARNDLRAPASRRPSPGHPETRRRDDGAPRVGDRRSVRGSHN